jgi:hypothetical protein
MLIQHFYWILINIDLSFWEINISQKILKKYYFNISEKMLIKKYWSTFLLFQHLWTKNCRQYSRKMLTKKCWQHFWKMLTKNVGNTSEKCWRKIFFLKNVDKKYFPKKCWRKKLVTLRKMLTEICWQHFWKMLVILPKNINFFPTFFENCLQHFAKCWKILFEPRVNIGSNINSWWNQYFLKNAVTFLKMFEEV